jgi:predicted extracellular nuclease
VRSRRGAPFGRSPAPVHPFGFLLSVARDSVPRIPATEPVPITTVLEAHVRLPLPPRRKAAIAALASAAMSAAVLPALAVPAHAVSDGVVISRVYGAGGNSNAVFRADYVELFNRGASAVSLGDLSLQYGSATGTGNIGANTGQATDLPAVTLQPGQYFLVQQAAGETGAALPTPDFVDPTPIAMAAGAGKVALVRGDASLGCNGGSAPCSPEQLDRIVDLIGYGGANFFEGSGPAPAIGAGSDAERHDDGCRDTDVNADDFQADSSPAPRTTASPLDPCGAVVDTPPAVSAVVPTAAATDVTIVSDISITFDEAVTVGAGAFSLTCAASGARTLTVSGGPATYSLDPASNLAYADTCTLTVEADAVVDQDGTPDPMAADLTTTFTTIANPCTVQATPIAAVQGAGEASPVVNTRVTTSGVVVADTEGLNGFFLQDPVGDGNPATSEGLFVFLPAANPLSSYDVQTGDVVAVTGTVREFQGLTELDTLLAIEVCGTAPVPAPTVYNLPEPTNNDLERVEGMLVTIPQPLTVQQNFFQGRYGQLTLGVGGRLYQPTNQFRFGTPEHAALAASNARAMIVLDDARSAQNPSPIPYLGEDSTTRAGDTVAGGLTGVIDYGPINSDTSIRDYRLHPTVEPQLSRTNPRTAAPERVGGTLKVASFNVLNYFTTFTGPDARGANSPAEFARQRTKIFAAVAAIDADVVGLIEIENSANDAANGAAIDDFVAGLNDHVGSAQYAKVPSPAPLGTDAIRVAMIYKPARVSLDGPALTYPDPAFANARVPLAQTFTVPATGETFSAVVNHFKSKGSCPAPTADPANADNGQGCWNADRVEQAQALVDFVGDIQQVSGDDDVLVLGDLNAYAEEDPILTLEAAGITDQLERFQGKDAYTYVFDGMSGYLDHGLATASLAAQISGVTAWDINADEPSVIDYNTEFKPQDLYAPTPYRSSDHDPVIVGLRLNSTSLSDLRALVNSLSTEGPVTASARASLLDRLDYAERMAAIGSEARTIAALEQFVARALNQIKGDAEDLAARDLLVREARRLIAYYQSIEDDENAPPAQQ